MQIAYFFKYSLLISCVAGSTLLSNAVYASKIKCWTNEDGITECGNIVPHQFTQQGHSIRNEQGLVVEKVQRAKTPEEIAREEERVRLEEEAAERKHKQEEQDRILLDLFSKPDDISIAREARLSTIDAQIGSIDFYLNSLRKNLAEMEASLENRNLSEVERKKIKRDIRGVKHRIKDSEKNLARKQMEKDEANALYDDYLKRFRAIQQRAAERERKQNQAM